MIKTLLFTPLSILLFLSPLTAQIGGRSTFTFLKQSPSARLTGLNQSQITLKDADIAIGYVNPAMYNPLMHNALSFNQDFRIGSIQNGFAAYGYHSAAIKTTFSGGVQYTNYGKFKQTDEFGNVQGEFKATEYALYVGASREINERLSVGMNLKYVGSQLESYTSNGIAADLAGAYVNPKKQFGATILLRNVGIQLKTYVKNSGNSELLPNDLQIGFSKKLARAPFRFSIAAHDLLRWQLRYDNPSNTDVTLLGEEASTPSRLSLGFDNFFRHIRMGGEIMFGKKENVRLRFGYDHQKRREMAIQNISSLSGFSFGGGICVSKFRIDYGFAKQHIAGGMNHISISTNLSEFKR